MKAWGRIGLTILGLIVVTVGVVYGGYQLSRARCFMVGAPVICRVETKAPKVALTFDDGPTELGLDVVLPLLEQHDARATFFLMGKDAETRPDLVRRIADAGHEVGNHSYTHKRMALKSRRFYDRELERTQAALAKAGVMATLFRPPYGKKLFGLPQAVREAGLKMVTWDVEDPATADPGAFADQVVAQARPGSIILIHPMYKANETGRSALPLILAGLKAKGLQAVTVSELLAEAEDGGE